MNLIDHDWETMSIGQDEKRWKRLAALIIVSASVVVAIWIALRPSISGNPGAVRPSLDPSQSSLTPEEHARIERVIAAGRLTLPDQVVALVPPDAGRTNARGPDPLFSPISPVGTAVRSSRPQFTWSDAGADAYTVTVFDETLNEIAHSARVGGTSWTASGDLPRGGTYRWQVTAHRGARNEIEPRPPRPDARFIVLDAAAAARIEGAESRLAGEPLALGILLAEAGLISEARVDLTRATKVAGTAAAARRLLESLP
ncbi:MAG: hypothetical protein ABI039_01925 [Vicinamibacterales bacterium]